MLRNIKNNLINIPGWRTNRKIVVIESDDWGSIRMPSLEVYNQLLKNKIAVDKDLFCKYDSIAQQDDFACLYEALQSVKDKNGRAAVLTANAVMANPDFERIRESNFETYYYKPFTDLLESSPAYNGVWDLWNEGMNEKIFRPQFHGREHLNVKKWLQALQLNESATRLAFDYGTFGLTDLTSDTIITHYMGAFDSALDKDIENYGEILSDGLRLFEQTFGFKSTSFIATTYTWSTGIEVYLKKQGVDFLQGLVNQRVPLDDGSLFGSKKGNFQGTKNKLGQYYLMRNCFFEPTHFRDKTDVVGDCLKRIEIAFRWKKAAVIGAHRLNFIGAINESNRTLNMILFRNLLAEIIKRWPDVEFMSSDELGEVMKSQKNKI